MGSSPIARLGAASRVARVEGRSLGLGSEMTIALIAREGAIEKAACRFRRTGESGWHQERASDLDSAVIMGVKGFRSGAK